MRKVAIYVRVSTLEQAESGYSISEQTDKLKKYAEIHDWNVYDVYADGGFSGSNTTRPSLERLITDAKRHKFDTVLVYKLDRLSRSQKDTLFLIEDVFNPNDIGFISMNENFDTTSAFGKAMIGILSVFAQLEREQIKERMQLGKVGRAKSGKSMTWHYVGFGYTYNKETGNLDIDPLTAPIVQQIFNEYMAGMSVTKLRDKLNNEGHIGKPKRWNYRGVRTILDNPLYHGVIRYKGEFYEGNHEPLITKELFEQTQIEIEKRQKQAYEKNNNPRPFQSKYMLSGTVRCGYCGAPLESVLGGIRKDGTRLRKYQCAARHKRAGAGSSTIYNNGEHCDSGFYQMSDLENQVLDAIGQLQFDENAIMAILEKDNPVKIDKKPLLQRLDNINKQLKKLSDLYMNDLITLDELQEKTEMIKFEKRGLEAKIEEEDIEATNFATLEQIKKVLGNVDIHKWDYEQQKKAVNQLIKKVDVTAEEMRIHWVF